MEIKNILDKNLCIQAYDFLLFTNDISFYTALLSDINYKLNLNKNESGLLTLLYKIPKDAKDLELDYTIFSDLKTRKTEIITIDL